MDTLSISEILKVSTFILAKIRFEACKSSTKYILRNLKNVYSQNIETWDYHEFLKTFECIEHFQNSANIIVQDLLSTNNIQEIKKYSSLIAEICEMCCALHDEQKYNQLSELIDAFHGLPEALLFKDIWNPKSFWKTYFKPYSKKWDKEFIKKKLKYF